MSSPASSQDGSHNRRAFIILGAVVLIAIMFLLVTKVLGHKSASATPPAAGTTATTSVRPPAPATATTAGATGKPATPTSPSGTIVPGSGRNPFQP